MSKGLKILILVLALAVITSGVALAAWLVTRSTTRTGVVVGSFSFTAEGVCAETVGGVEASCTARIDNEYDGTLYLSNPVVTTVRTDILVENVRLLATTVPVGEGSYLRWEYTPDEGAAIGDVVFDISVTGSDSP